MILRKARIRRLYDITSRFYEELYGCEQQKKFASIISLGLLKHSNFNVILDAGCGTGLITEKLRDKGAFVVGVDFSKGMLQRAKKKFSDVVDVDLVLSDVEYLPFRPRSFDLIVSVTVIQNCHPLKAFRSFLQVLSSDGLLVFTYPKRSREVRVLEVKLKSHILRDLDSVDNIVVLGGWEIAKIIKKMSKRVEVKPHGVIHQDVAK